MMSSLLVGKLPMCVLGTTVTHNSRNYTNIACVGVFPIQCSEDMLTEVIRRIISQNTGKTSIGLPVM